MRLQAEQRRRVAKHDLFAVFRTDRQTQETVAISVKGQEGKGTCIQKAIGKEAVGAVPREDIVLLSKVGFPKPPGPNLSGLTARFL